MFPFHTISSLLLFLSHTAHSDRHVCSDTAQCQNRTITCAPDEPCYVDCSGNWACRMTTVRCPDDEECHIRCFYNETAYHISRDYTSYLVCFNITIAATHSSLLTVNASFGNITEDKYIRTPKASTDMRWPRTMDYATVYCPHLSGGAPHRCQIHCDGDSLMRQVNLNAIQGNLDLRIASTSYNTPWCLRGATLNCRHDYASSCAMTTEPPWGCQDYANRRPETICEFPTLSPTEIPPFTTSVTAASESSTIITPSSRTALSSTIWISTTNGEDKLEAPDGDKSADQKGLTEYLVILIIMIPILFCACLCIGFGCYMLRSQPDMEGGKHSVIGEDEYEDDSFDVEANGTGHGMTHGMVDDDFEDELSENSSDSGVTTEMLGKHPEIYGKNRSAESTAYTVSAQDSSHDGSHSDTR